MKWRVVSVGKPKLRYAAAGIEEYAARLRPTLGLELVTVKAGDPAREGAELLARSEGCYRIVFDERGELASSREFAERIARLEMAGTKAVALLVGGAAGMPEEVRAAAGWVVAFGRMTLQHELALVAVLEQVYRAQSILRGAPYHRD